MKTLKKGNRYAPDTLKLFLVTRKNSHKLGKQSSLRGRLNFREREKKKKNFIFKKNYLKIR